MRQRYFFMPNNYKNLEKKYQFRPINCFWLLLYSNSEFVYGYH